MGGHASALRQGLTSADRRACDAAVSDHIPNPLGGGRLEKIQLMAHKRTHVLLLLIIVLVATAI